MTDLVIPSAVTPSDASRLRSFAREPGDRQFLACFHGEHAATKTRSDVAEGYREVNETVRLALLEHFKDRDNVSVGGPATGYSFFMGNCHFCLIPKGRGYWTVRLYEAFYSGCIPVLLSDGYAAPFEGWLDWSRFSLKWPMQRVTSGLYEHLQALVAERWDLVEALHRGVREAACWFDFHAPESASCSPYLGLARELEARVRGRGDGAHARRGPVQGPSAGGPVLQSYWF